MFQELRFKIIAISNSAKENLLIGVNFRANHIRTYVLCFCYVSTLNLFHKNHAPRCSEVIGGQSIYIETTNNLLSAIITTIPQH